MNATRIRYLYFLCCTLLTVTAHAQQFNYDKAWKAIGQLQEKGRYRSAYTQANALYAQSRKDHRDDQGIKALLTMQGLNGSLSDTKDLDNIRLLQRAAREAKGPAAAILQSLLADAYGSLGWRNYGRTTNANYLQEDMSTWSQEAFRSEAVRCYLASVKDTALLQATGLAGFKAIVVKGNTPGSRPTLYDLLARAAIDGLERIPAADNELPAKDTAWLAPTTAFLQLPLQTTGANRPTILHLYQQMIRQHLRDGNDTAMLEADLDRLDKVAAFLGYQYQGAQKQAMMRLVRQYHGHPATGHAYYMLAAMTSDLPAPAGHLEALAWTDSALAVTPGSPWIGKVRGLRADLLRKDLSLEIEKINLPGQPMRALLGYRNLAAIQLRLMRVPDSALKWMDREAGWAATRVLLRQPLVRSWEQPLPAGEDLEGHHTEIKIDALPVGTYVLVASMNKDFNIKDNVLNVLSFQVSGLALVTNADEGYVLDRRTGGPLPGSYMVLPRQRKRTPPADATGHLNLRQVEQSDTLAQRTFLVYKQDTLRLQVMDIFWQVSWQEINDRESPPQPGLRGSLLTDRAIYRPGQTIYFKGLLTTYNPNTGKFSAPGNNYSKWLYLYASNGSLLDSARVTLDDWGSCYGQLKIPASAPPGSCQIRWDDVNGSVQVEEYKRPQFEVALDPLKKTVSLGDSVQVSGQVKTYAGSSLANARVVYTVARNVYTIFYRPEFFYQGSPFLTDTVHTDADGRFICRFKADSMDDGRMRDNYNFTVNATATDPTGETHDANRSFMIGKSCVAFGIDLDQKGTLDTVALAHIAVHNNDQNGNALPVKLGYKLYALHAPDTVKRKRYWQEPDRFLIPEAEYRRDFPLDVYRSASDALNSWPVTEVVMTDSVTLPAGQDLVLPASHVASGAYLLRVFMQAPCGQQLEDSARFVFFDGKQVPPGEVLFGWLPHTQYAPRDTVDVPFGTAMDSVYFIQTRKTIGQKIQHAGWTQRGLHHVGLVLPDSLSSQVLDFLFVKDNRVYNVSRSFFVKRPAAALKISIGAHRDNLLPGARDRWQLKVSGATPAQLAAAMYDASLDAFTSHNWNLPESDPGRSGYFSWSLPGFGSDQANVLDRLKTRWYADPQYDYLGIPVAVDSVMKAVTEEGEAGDEMAAASAGSYRADKVVMNAPPSPMMKEARIAGKSAPGGAAVAPAPPPPPPSVTPRTNFAETAFFLPNLRTDSSNSVSFDFTLPESLTRWRFMAMAQNKQYEFGYTETNITTSKPLMVQANAPRFLRQGDTVEFSIRVSNTSATVQQGKASLTLQDATDMADVNAAFLNKRPSASFKLDAGQSTVLRFPIRVPDGFNSVLQYKVVAASGTFSDGEQNALPVMPRKILVQESLPFIVDRDTVRTYALTTLVHAENVKVELVSNPAWMAVQSLPYLMEYPYECAEQTFNRYYANCLGAYILASMPQVKQVFDKWKGDSAALLSNLEKNAELKSALLAETPWVLEAKTEAEQHAQVARLFDLYELGVNKTSAKAKLQAMQNGDGSFPWFDGMPANNYITRYIAAGIGRLQHLDISGTKDAGMQKITAAAVAYLDQSIWKGYDEQRATSRDRKIALTLDPDEVHYLYARSFFAQLPYADSTKTAHDYYLKQAAKNWLKQSTYNKSMLAIALYRAGDKQTANDILASLKDNAIENDGQGVHWNDVNDGWYWYESGIETMAQVAEAFTEVTHDTLMVNNIRTWLLANKQTNHWSTTKATADACYALLMQGSNWTQHAPDVQVAIGNTTIQSSATDAGMLQRLVSTPAHAVKSVTVTARNTQRQPSWGNLYWQYFQDADSVVAVKTGIAVQKELFLTKDSKLQRIDAQHRILPGDVVTVHMVINADRDMEFVHLKDMRAAAFEPVESLSGYRYQDGLGYYLAIRDAAMNFFFDWLPKGTHVLEYKVYATQQGSFSNGIATLQCMYAPAFSAHSAGQRVQVKE